METQWKVEPPSSKQSSYRSFVVWPALVLSGVLLCRVSYSVMSARELLTQDRGYWYALHWWGAMLLMWLAFLFAHTNAMDHLLARWARWRSSGIDILLSILSGAFLLWFILSWKDREKAKSDPSILLYTFIYLACLLTTAVIVRRLIAVLRARRALRKSRDTTSDQANTEDPFVSLHVTIEQIASASRSNQSHAWWELNESNWWKVNKDTTKLIGSKITRASEMLSAKDAKGDVTLDLQDAVIDVGVLTHSYPYNANNLCTLRESYLKQGDTIFAAGTVQSYNGDTPVLSSTEEHPLLIFAGTKAELVHNLHVELIVLYSLLVSIPLWVLLSVVWLVNTKL